MPRYEYRCQDCRKTFERVETFREHKPVAGRVTCPSCKSKNVSQVYGAVFVKTAKKS